MNISFIGTGIMATAIIKSILDHNLFKEEEIMGSFHRDKNAQEIKEHYRINTTTSNIEAAKFGDIVVFSIKPQVFESVANEVKDYIKDSQLVMSIMAGIDIETLQKNLLHKKVVRCMPNTPAQIGKGMTVWTATKEVEENTKESVKQILSSLGDEMYVDDEVYVDMATAISGTGPAYVFLFLESLINAGVHLGFSRKDSTELVYKTTLGSVLFAIQSGKHTSELRDMVTSPGGTAADALYELEKGGFRTVLEKAVYAAYQRTNYLKDLNKKKGA
ncbi:MAG: pyrroline-5-carboxylate reductase [Candidatus Atribacteria bacterium]|nr:pyrroline-5-carboxylate reductase [Candidatus Atribacteria bacterium]